MTAAGSGGCSGGSRRRPGWLLLWQDPWHVCRWRWRGKSNCTDAHLWLIWLVSKRKISVCVPVSSNICRPFSPQRLARVHFVFFSSWHSESVNILFVCACASTCSCPICPTSTKAWWRGVWGEGTWGTWVLDNYKSSQMTYTRRFRVSRTDKHADPHIFSVSRR